MSDSDNERKDALETLAVVRKFWKHILGTLGVGIIFLPLFYYGLDMIAYPWAHGLTGQSPEGKWTGEIKLSENATYLVNMTLDHDADLSGNRSNRVAKIAGMISICGKGTPATETEIYGDPSWTGSRVTLFSTIDFGENIKPERIPCTSTKDTLECVFDFEQPISNASRKFREEFKKVYTPKAEYNAKVPVQFTPDQNNEVTFAAKCSGRS